MTRFPILLSFLLALVTGRAEPIVPITPGTSWPYKMTQETGEGVALAGLQPDAKGKIHSVVIYRLDGTENVDGKELLKFEMIRDGVVTNTDLMTVDDGGINCAARIDTDGDMVKLNPPQTIVAGTLGTGTSWDFNGKADEADVRQHYRVIAQEDVVVPAGKFHAFHIHGEQTAPGAMTIDRWFTPGTGIVKDVTTTRSEEGELVRRISLELKERPKVSPRPEVKPLKKLSVGLSREAVGNFTGSFPADAPKICARWQGHGLRKEAKIRALFIAEDIGDNAPQDYTIDEATAAATAPDARGVFTLSQPEGGWTPGDYRVEFYADDALVDSVKFKITK